MDEQTFLRACGIERQTLELWIEQGWIVRDGAELGELQLARARLILELGRDLSVNEAGIDLLLEVLDRLYATRRDLMRLVRALDAVPEDVRARILAALREDR
jgi:chaperone modulatory protein CbpM